MKSGDAPTSDLLAAAYAEVRDGGPDDPVPNLVALHERGTPEVFAAAAGMLPDDDPVARELGARILRELGPYTWDGRRPFTDRAVPLLTERLRREPDPLILRWVISALGYNAAREALDVVLPFATHPHWLVRFHVAAALPGLVDPDQIEPEALAALELLCHDEDADTRYYALHALVDEVPGVDPDRLRRCLTSLHDDPDAQIREIARLGRVP